MKLYQQERSKAKACFYFVRTPLIYGTPYSIKAKNPDKHGAVGILWQNLVLPYYFLP